MRERENVKNEYAAQNYKGGNAGKENARILVTWLRLYRSVAYLTQRGTELHVMSMSISSSVVSPLVYLKDHTAELHHVLSLIHISEPTRPY